MRIKDITRYAKFKKPRNLEKSAKKASNFKPWNFSGLDLNSFESLQSIFDEGILVISRLSKFYSSMVSNLKCITKDRIGHLMKSLRWIQVVAELKEGNKRY